jgi:putative Ca2+/H+ antiporter (TMEM165/GDT1 family)
MDTRLFLTVFGAVFLAEIADKTQLATLLFAADGRHDKWAVFFGAAGALVLASALAVLFGSALALWLDPRYLSWAVGLAFIGIGVWALFRA